MANFPNNIMLTSFHNVFLIIIILIHFVNSEKRIPYLINLLFFFHRKLLLPSLQCRK